MRGSPGSILGPLLFVLLINDAYKVLDKANILLYADDTVVYFAHKDPLVIQNTLCEEAGKISKWLDKNHLILNLKMGKTELVLYGSCQMMTKVKPEIKVHIDNIPINESKSYTYLGVEIDKYLNFQSYVDNIYKKCTSRVKLLQRIRGTITPIVAETIFKSMIRPIITYCHPIHLSLSRYHIDKFESIQNRCYKIIENGSHNILRPNYDSIEETIRKKSLTDVFKIINNINSISLFEDYFQKRSHGCNTRGNNSLLEIPKIRTETARKMFRSKGAVLFNTLPSIIREEESLIIFKRKLTLGLV